MKRVLCVWLPDFPIQRLNNERPETKPAACVLYAESGNRAQVIIASIEAQRHGVRAGMSLAEAQALIESALFLPHDVSADARELTSLAGLCYHYSPFVGLQLSGETHCLVLDISGCGHLFGDESGLARQLVIDLAERGYFAHVATANTIGAAWAIARYGHCTGPDRRLRSLPVEALRIPDRLVTQLREFDLCRIGQLSALPEDSLPSRFGKLLSERLGQLYGRRDELIIPVSQPEPARATWTTEESISARQATQYVCPDLLPEILDTLKSRGEGLLKLTLLLKSDSTEPVSVDIRLARPDNSLPHVLKLLELKLETICLPERLHTVILEASAVATLQTRQRGLFAELQEPAETNREVRSLIERLSTRLGEDAVVRPHLLPEAIPEQGVGFSPLSGITSPTHPDAVSTVAGSAMAAARPLLLLPRPEPVQVSFDGQQPAGFYWNRHHHQIVRATKAERFATGWWQDSGSIQRDYFRVETSSGAQLWLFRDRDGHWFLHGLFE
ncbi:MAG: protein ImuB [Planctomycetaceae bacterium]|jgi:protein ImuB